MHRGKHLARSVCSFFPQGFALLGLVSLLSACQSGGQWGHARHYEPLSEEAAALSGAEEYDPVMAERSPEKWRDKTVHFFGVVVKRQEGKQGTADVTLSLRALEGRNLCETKAEDSCRVTVSDREHGRVHALLKLSPEDNIGEQALGPQSLVRVVGTIRDEASAGDGATVIQARYYRHWPRNYYVTSQARSYMLR